MKSKPKPLFVGGAVATIVAALALGVTARTLLLFGAALLCPAVMLFGSRGVGDHQCGHGGVRRNLDAHDAGHRTEDGESRKAA
jgi:fatty acid desaturase